MSLTKIRILDSQSNIIAEDSGDASFVTPELVKAKLLKKGIAFDDSIHSLTQESMVDEAAIKIEYDAMVKDIYDEMENVFGTRNDVSAQAFAATWEAMVKRPSNYVGNLGLVDEQAVLDFANAKLALADAYAIFRLERINTYGINKANIEAS